MAEKDLELMTEEGRFHYRVGAIIFHRGKFLLMRNEEAPYSYSVGGKVRLGESSEEAVRREVLEETGVELEIERVVAFHEQFFQEEVTGDHTHEIGLYYLMADSKELDHVSCHSVTTRGAGEELFWAAPNEVGEVGFVPSSIGEILTKLPEQFVHIVERD